MKKLFVVFILSILISSLYALTTPGVNNLINLVGGTWKFKTVISESAAAAEYVTNVYGDAKYHFDENHTYSGNFFGLTIAGMWEIADNTLILDKGTYKEEKYILTSSSADTFTIQVVENGSKVFIEFVKE